MWQAGDNLYSDLEIIDISDPANPTSLRTLDTPGYAYAVDVIGGLAFIADQACGLQVIDVSAPANPTFVSDYNTPGSARDVEVVGDYAYVADGSSGLQVIDITNPNAPTLTGSYGPTGFAKGVAVDGNYAYLAEGAGLGIEIIDIIDPSNPVLAGSFSTPGAPQDLDIAGDLAYVAALGGGLQIVDVSDPGNPTLAGHFDTAGGTAIKVQLVGNYAHIVGDLGSFGRLQIVDVSNPASPSLAAELTSPSSANGLAVMAEWSSDRSYSDRVANLNGTSGGSGDNGTYYLIAGDPADPATTVYDDGARDTLRGEKGRDWFFADLDNEDGDDDRVKDKKSYELLDLVYDL